MREDYVWKESKVIWKNVGSRCQPTPFEGLSTLKMWFAIHNSCSYCFIKDTGIFEQSYRITVIFVQFVLSSLCGRAQLYRMCLVDAHTDDQTQYMGK